MCRILILVDIRPMEYVHISFHAVVVFGLGKNLLFKSILERCGFALKTIGSEDSQKAKLQTWSVIMCFYLFQIMLFNNLLMNLIPQRWLSSQVHRNLKQKVMGAVVNLKSYSIQKLQNKRQRKAPVSTLCSVKIKIKLLIQQFL